MFSVGHLSDLHATPVRPERLSELLNKRLLGYASWRLKRRQRHRPHVLDALIADLRQVRPDHVVVTGDLTNIGLPSEFGPAREWLEKIGEPEWVSAVPGNHDAYVPVSRRVGWAHWSEYVDSDSPGPAATDPDDHGAGFPTLRVRGAVAFVGLCSALPTGALDATGRIGTAQLEGLEKLLTGLADSDLCRVVMLHHPPTEGAVAPRRALDDAEALRAVLRRAGADLVLHGHTHRTLYGSVEGPDGAIPVVGVRSSSDQGQRPNRRAQYHIYEIDRAPRGGTGRRFDITVRVRGFDPDSGGCVGEGERKL